MFAALYTWMYRFRFELLSVAGAVAVLWTMLLPGYILTLDLVWVPHIPLAWDPNGFNNAYPVVAFFRALSYMLPGWVGEKVMLGVLFFLLFYIPMRFLPWMKRDDARVFAAGVYALNLFVYARMLAGQWLVLYGYALLPLVLWALVRYTTPRDTRSAVYLGAALFLVGLFSVHFVYLALIISIVWVAAHEVRGRCVSPAFETATVSNAGLTLVIFFVLSSFWIVPAMVRHAPIEAQFDATHFAAFAATGNGSVTSLWNVAALGGYWGEGTVWNLYFVWPQVDPLFWATTGLLWTLVVLGIAAGAIGTKRRFSTVFLVVIGIGAYVTALGVGATPVQVLNAWLYAHMPLWDGLRDSQKIAGVLALAYATFAGIGLELLCTRIIVHRYMRILVYVLLLSVPIIGGEYEWGGFHGQLQPVAYPAAWYQAKTQIDALPQGKLVLVLPWHGYLSLDFDHQLIVSNPAPAFFGSDHIAASKSIDAGALHDVETDPVYRQLDALFATSTKPDSERMLDALDGAHIHTLFMLKNVSSTIIDRNWTDSFVEAQVGKHSIEIEQLVSRTRVFDK